MPTPPLPHGSSVETGATPPPLVLELGLPATPPPPHGNLVETGGHFVLQFSHVLELGLPDTPPPPHGNLVETGAVLVLQFSLSVATKFLGPRSAAEAGGPRILQLASKMYDFAMWITFIFDAVLVFYFLVRYIGLRDSPSVNRTVRYLMGTTVFVALATATLGYVVNTAVA